MKIDTVILLKTQLKHFLSEALTIQLQDPIISYKLYLSRLYLASIFFHDRNLNDYFDNLEIK